MKEMDSDRKIRADSLDQTGVRRMKAATSRLEKWVTVAEQIAVVAICIAALFQAWARTHMF